MNNKVIIRLEETISYLQAQVAEMRLEKKSYDDFDSIGKQLRKRRQELKEIGITFDHDPAYINRLENDIISPNLKTLVKLAADYDCHLALIPNN